MKEMHVSKKQLIFAAYDIDLLVEDFTVQAETYVFSGRRWFNIYVYHLPSDRVASRSMIAYRDSDVEKTVADLVFESMPRDDTALLDRLDRYFSEEVVLPEE